MISSLLGVVLTLCLVSSQVSPIPYTDVVINGKPHKVAFTFDDHPTRTTNAFLDILKRHKLVGTFFVVTYPIWIYYLNPRYSPAQARLTTLQRIKNEGHTIGNHSNTHDILCKKPYRVILTQEVGRAQKLIERATSVVPTLWRPPHGITCSNLRRATKQFGLTWVWWDVGDYRIPLKHMWYYLVTRVKRGETSTILLFHTNPQKFEKFLKLLAL